jgi:phosphonate transport system substrate-binding protein
MIFKKIRYIAIFLILFFLVPKSYAQNEILTLGIHPYLPSSELLDKFKLLADYLSKEVNKKVIIEVSKDYNDHIQKIGNDKFHIAVMGPFSYVKMVQKYGKKPILSRFEVDGKPVFKGAIVVSQDSDIKKLGDLKSKRFAFVDPESTMGYVVPLYLLLKEGIYLKDFSEYKFLYNHHNVALGVLAGAFDAGAIKEDVFYAYKKRGLRAIAWSPYISEHVFVASKKLPKETIKKLKESMIQLRDNEEGMKILRKIQNNLTGLVTASDKDYEDLSEIYRKLQKAGYKL